MLLRLGGVVVVTVAGGSVVPVPIGALLLLELVDGGLLLLVYAVDSTPAHFFLCRLVQAVESCLSLNAYSLVDSSSWLV